MTYPTTRAYTDAVHYAEQAKQEEAIINNPYSDAVRKANATIKAAAYRKLEQAAKQNEVKVTNK